VLRRRLTVRGRDQLHAALRDGPGRQRLGLGADLVYDDHLWHVVLHSLYHHTVLLLRVRHLRVAAASGAGVTPRRWGGRPPSPSRAAAQQLCRNQNINSEHALAPACGARGRCLGAARRRRHRSRCWCQQ
jgi:hypothetical protein